MAKTILVVEDDQNISELLRLYLEKEGYTVNIADDGGKGVELYRRLKPDLVLLDLMLPVLDGWGVLRAIRQDGKTPVIMPERQKSAVEEHTQIISALLGKDLDQSICAIRQHLTNSEHAFETVYHSGHMRQISKMLSSAFAEQSPQA